MPNYKRANFKGGYYFFTLVTCNREELFHKESACNFLRETINTTRSRHPFETIAFCLLYNHLHCIWKLPENDSGFSMRWSSIKGLFSKAYLKTNGCKKPVSPSHFQKGEVCIWQRRFWEHQIRDENDLQNHIDYIHYNPVKHGLVKNIEDWSWSTYHKFVKEGFYGQLNDFETINRIEDNNFGE
ncbi:MAG: transposase [Sedimentisphaerales bacterium]|nr:transposase [Sedimentisphaerales bacterium]